MTNLSTTNATTTASVAASTTASTSNSGSAASLTQSDFLQLLTAQLKYQSPTSPADPTQMASEFAAISTVNGIDSLNTKLSNLSTSTGAAQIAQASSLVGKQVAVTGNTLISGTNGTADGAFNLAGATKNTTVTIMNSDGSIATTLNLGALSAGQQDFSWSGGTAGTSYTYNVTASDSTGAAVTTTPYTVYTVQGVNLSSTSPTLNVAGSATTIPVSSVQTVLGASS
ncbi:flagellar hook assembly protein FlgD [Acidocella aromatica]|uniref:Basal-body rod modification protein FlgD n=1 Tax=Acidocella aromatica TaxID=1303579 RepID=A0A840VCX6_9PROT|nr:flagellar hook capping FlgD N-terminal domain-containing protein [Acidocella aromatica]MBB5373738.1 flagellar basal-body rod modification protein FlgD [Acidocella aromatica]